jgi:6-phosphogluconolactonase (cycloisomerase 2 family)
VTVALHGDLLYVANAGGLAPNTHGPAATIAGFTVADDGELTPIHGSTTDLPGGPTAGPSQIQISPDGSELVVTERQKSMIDVFPLDDDGVPGAPVRTRSNGGGPFTATFRGQDILVSSEVVGYNFKYGGLTTYRVGADGSLQVITRSLNTTEFAACWTVDSILDPKVVYLVNAQSGTIAGVRIDENGKATLFPADGHLATTRDQKAGQDIALSLDGRYLYLLTVGFDEKLADPRLPTHVPGTPYTGKMSISAWRVEASGALTPLPGYGVQDDPPTVTAPGVIAPSLGGLPPGSEGMVAF